MKTHKPVIQSSKTCPVRSFPGVSISIARGQWTILWNDETVAGLNPLEEDLVLQIIPEGSDTPAIERKCSFLNQVECPVDIEKGARVILAAKEKFRLNISAPDGMTPRISFVSENEGRHHLSWHDVEWDRIRHDVESATRLDWESDVELWLRVRRDGRTGGSERSDREWIDVGFSNHALVTGFVTEISLVIMEKGAIDRGNGAPLKDNPFPLATIFTIEFPSPEIKRVLFSETLDIPGHSPFMELKREVWEEDTVQARAWWDISPEEWREIADRFEAAHSISWQDVELKVNLYRLDARGRTLLRVSAPLPPGVSDWFFDSLDDNNALFAVLAAYPADENGNYPEGIPIIESSPAVVPAREDHITLLPVDEARAFAYWHLDRARLDKGLGDFAEAHGEVKTHIRVFHEFGGSLHHHPDRDVEVHLGITDSYYIALEPDRVYRVQLIATAGDGSVKELTAPSNAIQTIRRGHGHNPPVYRDVAFSGEHPVFAPVRSVMDSALHSSGLLAIHLHAHLPFIRERVSYGTSGVWQPMGYPPEWFHEAVRETYVPLIRMFEKLVDEGVDFRLSMDISPTLSNMMRSPMLQDEFLKYMDAHISLARAEVDRTWREARHYHDTARMHLERFLETKNCFIRYGCDLTRAFARFQETGCLEISTCGATHAFLPFYTAYPESVRAQIETAVNDYNDTFGRMPLGIWLPECAYTPGIERHVEAAGLRYFFTETHGVLDADAHVQFGVHAPVFIKGSDVAAFARDPETGKQVWSGDEGYPGDPDYLEFHMKGGPLKYNRITSRDNNFKEAYVRERAMEKAALHAQHFMEARNFRFQHIRNWFWKKPVVVAMYDAELFGHHWYEGVDFLYFLLKKLYYNQNETELITPGAYLRRYGRNQEVFLNPSSWGDKGTFDKWMYGSVSWMYRHTHEAIREMVAIATEIRNSRRNDEFAVRAGAQAAREVLQAMNSDIPFVISNGHFVDRMKEFYLGDLERFWIAAALFWHGGHNETALCRLKELEAANPVFPDINPEVFAIGG